jgi:hypothetical protein
MTKPTLSAEDRLWRSKSDAQTLMDAEEVKADTIRLKAALAQAKTIADEAKKKATAAEKISKMKSNKKPVRTKTSTRKK